jgi:hypothetical protein
MVDNFSPTALIRRALFHGESVTDILTLCRNIAAANPKCNVLQEKGLLGLIASFTVPTQTYIVQEAATMTYVSLIGGGRDVTNQAEIANIATIVGILKVLNVGSGGMRLAAYATFQMFSRVYDGNAEMAPYLDEFQKLFDEEAVVSS